MNGNDRADLIQDDASNLASAARVNVRSAATQLVTAATLLVAVLFALVGYYEIAWRYRPPFIIGRLVGSELRFLAWVAVAGLVLYIGLLYPLLLKSLREAREAADLMTRVEHAKESGGGRRFRA